MQSFFGKEKIKLITWECTLFNEFEWEFYEKLISRNSGEPSKPGFILREASNVLEKIIRSGKEKGMLEKFCPHDLYAAAVMIQPSLVKKSVTKCIEIELHGKTRGTCIIDWYNHETGADKINVEMVQELD